jgi:DNA polymerase II small subunit
VYAEEVESKLEIDEGSDVSGKSACDGDIEDFITHFNERYSGLSKIIRDRLDYRAYSTIENLRKGVSGREKTRLVCMVGNKRESGKGHRFFDVEDPSGQITVLLPQTDQRMKTAYERTLLDEVVGIEGRLSNDIFIADDVVQPEIPTTNQPHTASEPVHAVFLSDLHIGSYLFLEKEFARFLDWLSGKGNGGEISEKVKYILIAGDLVDGIGIYPRQEKELVIPDVYRQYEFLGALLAKIPDYIEVVVAMGNHDAVRNAEPQPKLPKDIGAPLYGLENVHVTGNPVHVVTHGVRTLMYHGTTLDTMIASLSGCTYSAPENAMIEYLRRRHLAPVYGKDPLAPEEVDYMMIKTLPDILHCGHIHTNGYGQYRGVRVINSGTFQAKTKYQEQLGHKPTPAKVPVVNLQNLEVSVVDFGG